MQSLQGYYRLNSSFNKLSFKKKFNYLYADNLKENICLPEKPQRISVECEKVTLLSLNSINKPSTCITQKKII